MPTVGEGICKEHRIFYLRLDGGATTSAASLRAWLAESDNPGTAYSNWPDDLAV
jgi:hypothetical protein